MGGGLIGGELAGDAPVCSGPPGMEGGAATDQLGGRSTEPVTGTTGFGAMASGASLDGVCGATCASKRPESPSA